MMKKGVNPSVIQSKSLIIDSLIDLMQIKQINEISISEISENAEISRRTFYRNFTSKEDVLDDYFKIVFSEVKEEIDKLGDEINCMLAIRVIFKLCDKHKDFFLALSNSNMLGFMLERWNTALPVLHTIFLDRIKSFPQINSNQTLDYLLAFNVGGTFNMVMKWINDGMKIPADKVADIVEEFAFGTLMDNKIIKSDLYSPSK